jgi:hypothetical protein
MVWSPIINRVFAIGIFPRSILHGGRLPPHMGGRLAKVVTTGCAVADQPLYTARRTPGSDPRI